MMMQGRNVYQLNLEDPPIIDTNRFPIWIEGIWRNDEDGRIYAWYHHEPSGLCPGNYLTAPEIGALVSDDDGATFHDFGTILKSKYPINCAAIDKFFGGGHGDFSVMLDQNRQYFYIVYTNYGGPSFSQGVAVARMAFADRDNPVGKVMKYYSGDWAEAGLGGEVTPVLPAFRSWPEKNTDSFWGPAIHWNTFLQTYVVLLNRSCCTDDWPQEGIYISYVRDLSKMSTWTAPEKILDVSDFRYDLPYYPEVMGLAPGDTDTLVGETARLYVKGISMWQLTFIKESEQDPMCSATDRRSRANPFGCMPQTPGVRRLPVIQQ